MRPWLRRRSNNCWRSRTLEGLQVEVVGGRLRGSDKIWLLIGRTIRFSHHQTSFSFPPEIQPEPSHRYRRPVSLSWWAIFHPPTTISSCHQKYTNSWSIYQCFEHLQVHMFSLQPEFEASHGDVRGGDWSTLTLISRSGLPSSHPDQRGLAPPLSVARGQQECCELWSINIDHRRTRDLIHLASCDCHGSETIEQC